MRNEGMLRKVGDYIAENPERYDQGMWYSFSPVEGAAPERFGPPGESLDRREVRKFVFREGDVCTSTACLAGTAALLHPDFHGWLAGSEGPHEAYQVLLTSAADPRPISAVGQEALGLDDDEVEELFRENWRPKRSRDDQPLHEAVRDALYALADGADLRDVTFYYDDPDRDV